MNINKNKIVGLVMAITIVSIIVVVIAILANGKTETFGKNPKDVQSESLVCISQNIAYPFFSYDYSKGKELKIIVNFRNQDTDAISLTYTLNYDDARQIIASEAINHADMNNSFSKNGLAPDSFNTHYSKMDNSMRMSLYAASNDINDLAARYFMYKTDAQVRVPNNMTDYKMIYEQQGFDCEIIN